MNSSNWLDTFSRWSVLCAGCFTPRKEYKYSLYRRLEEPQGWCKLLWRRGNLLSPLGFEIRIVQLIAKCYTNYAVLDILLQTAQCLDVELPQKMVFDQHKGRRVLKNQYIYCLGKAKYFLYLNSSDCFTTGILF
jgi:hypothetical protein